jgi:hypothetical protein
MEETLEGGRGLFWVVAPMEREREREYIFLSYLAQLFLK